MIEFNANGIGGFAILLKKFFSWLLLEGKEFAVYLGILVISSVKSVRQWVKKTIYQYFYEKDLSSKELSTQIQTLNMIMKVLQTVIGVFVLRLVFLKAKKMLF